MVQFVINKKGDIVNINARAPHSDLVDEAIRIINLLPKITPAIHKDKTVDMPYTLPITFQVK